MKVLEKVEVREKGKLEESSRPNKKSKSSKSEDHKLGSDMERWCDK